MANKLKKQMRQIEFLPKKYRKRIKKVLKDIMREADDDGIAEEEREMAVVALNQARVRLALMGKR